MSWRFQGEYCFVQSVWHGTTQYFGRQSRCMGARETLTLVTRGRTRLMQALPHASGVPKRVIPACTPTTRRTADPPVLLAPCNHHSLLTRPETNVGWWRKRYESYVRECWEGRAFALVRHRAIWIRMTDQQEVCCLSVADLPLPSKGRPCAPKMTASHSA